jgi:hypothetical protein
VFESIASYKGLVIALILSNGDLIKIELFDDTCAEFWNKNVITHERKYPMPRKNHYFHTFKGEIVVGYHCSNKEAN